MADPPSPGGKGGKWTAAEEAQFERGVVVHGWSNWRCVDPLVPTRSRAQIKSHAQKVAKWRPEDVEQLKREHLQYKATGAMDDDDDDETLSALAALKRGRRAVRSPTRRRSASMARSKSKVKSKVKSNATKKATRGRSSSRRRASAPSFGDVNSAKKTRSSARKASAEKTSKQDKPPAVPEATRRSLRLKLQPRRKSAPAGVPTTPVKNKAHDAPGAASPSKKFKSPATAPSSPTEPLLKPMSPRRVSLASLPPSIPTPPEPLLFSIPTSPVARRVSLAGPLALSPIANPAFVRPSEPVPPMTSDILPGMFAEGLDDVEALMAPMAGPGLRPLRLKRSSHSEAWNEHWANPDQIDEMESQRPNRAAVVTPNDSPVPWLSEIVPATPRPEGAFEELQAVTPSPCVARGMLKAKSGDALDAEALSLSNAEDEELMKGVEAVVDLANADEQEPAETQINGIIDPMAVREKNGSRNTDLLDPEWGQILEAITDGMLSENKSTAVKSESPTLNSFSKSAVPVYDEGWAAPPVAGVAAKASAPFTDAAPTLTVPIDARPDPKMFAAIRSHLTSAPDYNDPNEYVLGADGLSRLGKEKGTLCRTRIKGILKEHLNVGWWRDDAFARGISNAGGDDPGLLHAALDAVDYRADAGLDEYAKGALRKYLLEHLVALAAVMLDVETWHRSEVRDDDDVLNVGQILSGLLTRVTCALRKDGFALLLDGSATSFSLMKRKESIDEMAADLDSISRGERKDIPVSPRASLYDRE